jgi:hypothetical protein
VTTCAKRNVLTTMNIQRGAWKNVDSLASMHSVIYVARSPVLLVRNHVDGEHHFLNNREIFNFRPISGTATTTPVLSHVARSV